MTNLTKKWFLDIRKQTKETNRCNLTDEELKSIDEFERIKSGEWKNEKKEPMSDL